MPCNFEYSDGDLWKVMNLAEEQVRKKFPSLVKGTPGWYRAVENRFRRLR